MKTIEEAKEYLRESVGEGIAVQCPCCTQNVKLYQRKITSSMGYAMIMLRSELGFVHMEDFLKKKNCPSSIRGDVSKLRFWGLLEPGDTGYYRVTPLGRNFVDGKYKVMKFVHLFNNKMYRESGDLVSIKEVLRDKFNYEELMAR